MADLQRDTPVDPVAADDLAWVAPLRDALRGADYRYDVVAELLGPAAHAALSRNETVPGLRATAGGAPIDTLTRLWLLQAVVPAASVEQALPGLLDPLCAAGVLERSVGEVAARVDVRPYAVDTPAPGRDLFVASDLTPGLDGTAQRVGADHVLGISPAATSLAELTVRRPVGRALDLGTGCGVQALHLSAHAAHVVATDVNRRALWLTRVNAALNDVALDVREGSYWDPVRDDEPFDLVVTNPPFVISPALGERLVYRDSGLPGDRVVEQLVRTAPRHLAPGGVCEVLGNWMVLEGQPWDERIEGWLAGCDAWVVERERVDLPTYVELWLKDAGLHPSTGGEAEDYRRRYDTWLSWFADQGAVAVGFGWLVLRATGASEPAVRIEQWPYEVAQPLGPEVAAHLDRVDWLRAADDDRLAATALRLRPDVVQDTHGPVGAEDPGVIVLRQQTGMRRARQVSTAEAALLGACDGDLPVGRLIAAVTDLVGADLDLATVRALVAEGWLEPLAPS
ncbi:MAG: DUF7059 domain-containing protein [Marmoricola sp.]